MQAHPAHHAQCRQPGPAPPPVRQPAPGQQQQRQVDHRQQGVDANLLAVDDRQRRQHHQPGGQPGGRAEALDFEPRLATPTAGSSEDQGHRQQPGQHAQVATGERRHANESQPPLEQEEVQRRMNVVQPIADDVGRARCGQMQTDTLVPPQALPIQAVEAQGVGPQQQEQDSGERALRHVHGATTLSVHGRMR